MDEERIIWRGRPYNGIAWRPTDPAPSILMLLWTALLLNFADQTSWLFLVVGVSAPAYILAGRFLHDAYLRRRIRYELSRHGLEIWLDGRNAPECVFDLFQLRNVKPQFVAASGRGTIELPPGGWAAEPEWMNRWDRMVPAMYPCRRLELIDDAEAICELIRREFRTAQRQVRCSRWEMPSGSSWRGSD